MWEGPKTPQLALKIEGSHRQEVPAGSRSWKMIPPYHYQKEIQTCQYLDFSLLRSTSDFQSAKL